MDWKSAFLMNIKEIAGVAGRTILSCLVLWLLSVCLSIFLRSSYSLTGEEPARAEQGGSPPVRGPGVAKSSPSLWPHFPTSSAVRRRELGVNGVDYITENWETCASQATILEYYKCQMVARGWRDVTEESYNLKPEVHREQSGDTGLQDPQFLEIYRKVTGSCLALSRGTWSIHVATEERPGKAGWVQVTICGAAAPSVKDFARPWLPAPDARGVMTPQGLNVVEESGDQRYQTKITYQPQDPASAFREALLNLQKGNWRPMFAASPKRAGQGHSALLVRGDQYGSLAVTPSRNGQGASVAWTEVSPAE